MKLTLTAFFLMCMGTSAWAQSKFNVSGIIMEKESSEPIASASVRILSLPDSTMVTGAATNVDGSFSIKDVKKGKYVAKITFIGYQDRLMPLDLTNKKEKNVNIGYLTLVPDSKLLTEATVSANVAKVQVSGDSLVYNAAAYRVPEGSTLQDLVKKLPGAKVDGSGNITINGKSVKKILVDGKEFFISDTKTAMENLPTDMIEKLKTYDRKSDYSRVTGIDDGEEETVLDLSVKKGMKNGIFGNFNAGYGTEDRYDERVYLQRYNDSSMLTLLGGLNNTGRRGFGGGGGRGWGWGGNGLSDNKDFGVNYAMQTDKLELGGSVHYRYNGSDVWNQSSTQSFLTSKGAFSNSESTSLSSSHNWNAQFRMEWKPDSMTNIIFRPSGSFSRSYGFYNSESATFSDDPYTVSDDPLKDAISSVDASGDGDGAGSITADDVIRNIVVNTNQNRSQSFSENKNVSGELQANRRLNNTGRNLTFRATGNLSSSESKQLSAARIDYASNNSQTINNRYYTTPGRNRSFSTQLSYSEPIADRTYLQFSYRFNYSYRKSDREAFIMDAASYTDLNNALTRYRKNISGAIDYLLENGHKLFGRNDASLNEDYAKDADKLSQYSLYKNMDHAVSVSFRKTTTAYNFSLGVDLLPQHSELDYRYMGKEYPTITRNVFNYAPNLDLRYNLDKQTNLRVYYRGRTSQPSMTNLLDITDDSNPLYITKGNPGLKPSFSHNLNLNFNSFKQEHQTGVFAWGGASMTQNSVANRTSYNETTGVRTSRPENINGNWNANLGGGFNTSLDKNNYFTMNTYTGFNYNHNVSYLDPLQFEDDKSTTNDYSIDENLGFNFRKDWLDVGVNGSFTYNKSNNSVLTTNNKSTWDFSYGMDMTLTFNNGLSFSTDVSENSRRGYSSKSMNTNEFLWNAQVSQTFLKNRALSISLEWNDILRNQSNISRTIDAYQRSDSRYNAIYSYAMLHAIYRVSIFGGKSSTNGPRGFGGGHGYGGRPAMMF